MAEIADAFEQWMRDYITDGVPASGINPPSKAEGRAIGAVIEAYIDAHVIDLVNTILGAPPATPGPYVMPAYAAVGAIGYGGTSAAAAWPSVLADDVAFLLICAEENNGAAAVADPVRPSGWTQAGSTVTEGQIKAALYWRRCDGAESGSQTVLTTGGTAHTTTAAVISTWRGCVANGDPYEALDTNHATATSMPSRSVTTSDVQRLVVNLWACVHGGAESLSGADTGFTEVFSGIHSAFPSHRFIGDVQAAALASTVGVDTRTLTSNLGWACFSLALLPSS